MTLCALLVLIETVVHAGMMLACTWEVLHQPQVATAD